MPTSSAKRARRSAASGNARPGAMPETPIAPHRRSPARTGAATAVSGRRPGWRSGPSTRAGAAGAGHRAPPAPRRRAPRPAGRSGGAPGSAHAPTGSPCRPPRSAPARRSRRRSGAPPPRTPGRTTDCGSSSSATAVATRRSAPCSSASRRFSASRPRSSSSAAWRAVMSSTTAAITGGRLGAHQLHPHLDGVGACRRGGGGWSRTGRARRRRVRSGSTIASKAVAVELGQQVERGHPMELVHRVAGVGDGAPVDLHQPQGARVEDVDLVARLRQDAPEAAHHPLAAAALRDVGEARDDRGRRPSSPGDGSALTAIQRRSPSGHRQAHHDVGLRAPGGGRDGGGVLVARQRACRPRGPAASGDQSRPTISAAGTRRMRSALGLHEHDGPVQCVDHDALVHRRDHRPVVVVARRAGPARPTRGPPPPRPPRRRSRAPRRSPPSGPSPGIVVPSRRTSTADASARDVPETRRGRPAAGRRPTTGGAASCPTISSRG